MDILNAMVKSSSDNYSKSSVKCLVISLCLYIYLTEAKIANESMMSVQSLNILHLHLLKQVVSYFLACTFGQTLGTADFSCPVFRFAQLREVKYLCHRCSKSVARNSNISNSSNIIAVV